MVSEDLKFIAVDENGKATSRRFHIYEDCKTLLDTTAGKLEPVNASTITLLGLKECAVCEKRSTGGPAIDVLEGFFGEDWQDSTNDGTPVGWAWRLYEYLKERSFYIAQRKPKGGE